jgi:hypothetical protein
MKEKSCQSVEWSREVEEFFDDVIDHNVIGVNVRTGKEISEDHIWEQQYQIKICILNR